MTSSHLIDTEQLLADQLAQASPDLLRGLLSTFIAALMGAEADACAERATANAAMSGPISATATATVISTPVPQPSTSRSAAATTGPAHTGHTRPAVAAITPQQPAGPARLPGSRRPVGTVADQRRPSSVCAGPLIKPSTCCSTACSGDALAASALA